MLKPNIVLIGGGGHCRSCIDVIEMEDRYRIEGILDVTEKVGKDVLGYPIIGTDDDLGKLADKIDFFFITIGQVRPDNTRIFHFDRLRSFKQKLATIISPLAYVSKYASIGQGSIIMHFAQVNASAQIGMNCIINSKALIEHDVVIGDHCHISTGAIINGGAVIGKNSFMGSGSIIVQGIEVPSNSFIKANSILK